MNNLFLNWTPLNELLGIIQINIVLQIRKFFRLIISNYLEHHRHFQKLLHYLHL